MNQYLLVAGLLGELTAELQRLERWQAEHPGAEALASELPFCVDTLSFDQWLQFVLIPRMEQLVLLQAPLPSVMLLLCEVVYGLLAGVLFWRYGLESAILAHLVAYLLSHGLV